MLGIRADYSWAELGLSFGATVILIVTAVTSLVLRYVTSPISCFVPAQFTAAHVAYAHEMCFQSTSIYSAIGTDGQAMPTSHQWLPFFLGLSAILCLLPHVIWRMLTAGFLWLDLHLFTSTLSSSGLQGGAGRHMMLRDCALLLRTGLKGGNSGLAVAALARKTLVCAVCFVQMLLMVLVFQPRLGNGVEEGQEEEGGGEVPQGYVAGNNGSVPLPVDAFMCKLSIPRFGDLTTFEFTCVLTFSQVFTKGLVFLLVFFLALFMICVLDLATVALRLLMPRVKDATLTRFLALPSQSGGRPEAGDPGLVTRFLDSLGVDGRWVVVVVSEVCGPLTAADLTQHLFQVFKDPPRPYPTSDGASVPMGDIDGDGTGQDLGKGSMC